MPHHASPKCSVQWFCGEGKGSLHHLFFIAWMFTLRKLFLYITLILKDYLISTSSRLSLFHIKKTGNVYIFSYYPLKKLYYKLGSLMEADF